MYFDSLNALLTMDGHGAYVWTAYAVTLLVIIAILCVPLWRRRRVLRLLRGELARAQGVPRGGAREVN